MWTDEYISTQLLETHLNQATDLASRKESTISSTMEWILQKVPGNRMSILDLGCGPGLYTERLAQKGHIVTGIDFSENSISHARKSAEKGFWRPTPYLALHEGIYYRNEKVVLSQHVIIDETEETEIYRFWTHRFWTHRFSDNDLKGILEANKFTEPIFYKEVIPDSDSYRSGDVTFCITARQGI